MSACVRLVKRIVGGSSAVCFSLEWSGWVVVSWSCIVRLHRV